MTWAIAALPDPDEAREWAERELEKRVYREAEPTLFDRVAKAIGDFFAGLFSPQAGDAAWSPVWTAIIVIVVVAAIVVAFVIWGVPRADRRTIARGSSSVFEQDERSAAELRAAAEDAAARGAWDDAIVLRFRALARALDERGIVHAPPGMTARAFTGAAREFFPDRAAALDDAADAFDDVRYLRRPGTREMFALVAGLDDAIARERPAKAPEAAFS